MLPRESSELTRKLSFSFTELTLAYDATVQLFAAGLDNREREAEGHTQRVMKNGLKLAREMGMSDDELVHFQRGALLHDFGNLAVPESILQKEGKLTSQEWYTVHMHPTYAYEMMAPIVYLRTVIDIPYCHHERWNGLGYPRGLRGEQIPLAARIFSVIDAYDALTSNRPYRKAWSVEKTVEHITDQSGSSFDPQVVSVFIGNAVLFTGRGNQSQDD